LAGGVVEKIDPSGHVHKLSFEGSATALGDGNELLVATAKELLAFKPDGTIAQRASVDIGVTAFARMSETSFVVGYRDGSIELVMVDGSNRNDIGSFERHPSSAPTRIVIGPMDTVLVGFESGVLGMWDLSDGTRLAHARLHGPIVHVARSDDTFDAATELGDALHWDLSAFTGDHCTLLRKLWARVPVVWRAGRAVSEPPPSDHTCR
jgi:hypothetical protein